MVSTRSPAQVYDSGRGKGRDVPCVDAQQVSVVTDKVVDVRWTVRVKEHINVWFYIAQYPVRWTAQSALLHPLADLFIPTPTQLI